MGPVCLRDAVGVLVGGGDPVATSPGSRLAAARLALQVDRLLTRSRPAVGRAGARSSSEPAASSSLARSRADVVVVEGRRLEVRAPSAGDKGAGAEDVLGVVWPGAAVNGSLGPPGVQPARACATPPRAAGRRFASGPCSTSKRGRPRCVAGRDGRCRRCRSRVSPSSELRAEQPTTLPSKWRDVSARPDQPQAARARRRR